MKAGGAEDLSPAEPKFTLHVLTAIETIEFEATSGAVQSTHRLEWLNGEDVKSGCIGKPANSPRFSQGGQLIFEFCNLVANILKLSQCNGGPESPRAFAW